MHTQKEQGEIQRHSQNNLFTLKNSKEEEGISKDPLANPHLAFEKNYPKNVFIPLIQHLCQIGFKTAYEACVGTRESFQGKNVVSLAEIYALISQPWFVESINLTALMSTMSNKILMNSKIKKKLFHLLIIRQLFTLPLQDCKEFKKLVSKRASEVTMSLLPNHPLFNYPSALIYLLRVLAQGLQFGENEGLRDYLDSDQLLFDDEGNKLGTCDQNSNTCKTSSKEQSSKEESKFYMTKIIHNLNGFSGEMIEQFDLLSQIKLYIGQKEKEVRDIYKLPMFAPEWSYFGSIVIDNCLIAKRNKQKLTFSLLNQWVQEFREVSTSFKGFSALIERKEQGSHEFHPIILVKPPTS